VFKKIGIVLLAAALLLTLTSCGVKESVNDKIAEKVTEGVMNKATGGDANIDIDGDKITVEGKDGEKVSLAIVNGRLSLPTIEYRNLNPARSYPR
jgi:hypothetical protein